MSDDNVIEWPLKNRARTAEMFVKVYVKGERENGREPDDESVAAVEEVARNVCAEYLDPLTNLHGRLEAAAADGSLAELIKDDPSLPSQITDQFASLLARMTMEIVDHRITELKLAKQLRVVADDEIG